jgi:opacity protein-like surface antigen
MPHRSSSSTTPRTLAALALGIAAFASAPGVARAVEGQHHVGLAPELAMLKVDDKSSLSVGAGGALHYTYGLTDTFNLMAEGGSAVVALDQRQDSPESPRTRPATVDRLGVGVGYVIDILRYVPYVGVLATGYRLAGGTLDKSLFVGGAALALGLDYQITRNWTVGVAARQAFMLTKMSTYPSFTTVGLRLEYTWGF